jgi:hypothetical protein
MLAMAGAIKTYPNRLHGRRFPHSRYDDPRGGRASALERNVLRYRATETTLYLFYAEEVRKFMMTSIYPLAINNSTTSPWVTTEEQRLKRVLGQLLTDAELAGTLASADAQKARASGYYDPKEGKKLRRAFDYAVNAGIFVATEADELVELLSYRNVVAHRIHLIMSEVSRSYWASDHFAFDPPIYKSDALGRLRNYKASLSGRARNLVQMVSMDALLFEHAERTFEGELKRLDRLIHMQIRREEQRVCAINAELDLSGSDLTGDLHPRFPYNHHSNGCDGAPATGHLTKRGVEICYRLYDLGKSPLAVSYIMGMSLRAAQVRKTGWLAAGGPSRTRESVKRYDSSMASS